MPETSPVKFLLNQSAATQDNQVVAASAFSLTKVLAAGAVIVTPIATALVHNLAKVPLSAGNYVALAAAVLGFLAIASAADVLGRSYATAANQRAAAAMTGLAQVVTFPAPLAGTLVQEGKDQAIQVLASANVGEPVVLAMNGDGVKWLKMSAVTIP
jgi:hypothetical protein